MTSDTVRSAARNNAAWCDAVCRAHGRPGVFTDTLWFNRHETPRFYPDAVTTAGAQAGAAQLDALDALTAVDQRKGWAVKDSFAALDLSSRGFRVLFDAQWIHREPSTVRREQARDGLRWVRVADAAALRAWELALMGDSADDHTASPIFMPRLLASDGVALFAAEQAGEITGGGALIMAAGVVGASNVFSALVDHTDVWHGLLDQAERLYPGAAVVGYEHGDDLEIARMAGFDPVGPLRVWARG